MSILLILEPTTSEEHDKLLKTLQTFGRLGDKAARRVYGNVIINLRTLNRDKVKGYIANIVEFLQLTHYLHAVNEKVHELTSPSTKASKSTGSKKKKQTSNGVKRE